jgi:toxin YhaV
MKINGWTLIAHPLFAEQLNKLGNAVEEAKRKDPTGYKKSSNAKLLANILEIVLRRIPADPTDKRYRLGDTLGDKYKHWFRDKFASGRYRLFFRYDGNSKIIAYVWVNDENSLRTYGAKGDAYAVFKKMLDSGDPPDGWDKLRAQCENLESIDEVEKKIDEDDDR